MRIGFVDYYLDEWHANNYPEFIKKISEGRHEVVCAYAKIDSPIGGMTSNEWSEKNGIPLVDSIEEVVEKSDAIIVLSPDNPEMHLELTDLPLKSGKLVYVDKTFAPDKETAIKIFANADAHGTKCYSSSALRFCTEWKNVNKSSIDKIYSEAPNVFEIYGIHQIEPIVMLMESRAKRIMALDDEKHAELIIEFEDGRRAHMYHRIDPDYSFKITTVDKANIATIYQVKSNYFELFITDLVRFFDTGDIPVSHEQTIDVIGIIEAGNKALKEPFKWFEI